jgi:hypothetical protein
MNHTFNATISNEIMRMNKYKAAGGIGKLRISALAFALALFLAKIISRAEPAGPHKAFIHSRSAWGRGVLRTSPRGGSRESGELGEVRRPRLLHFGFLTSPSD